jgi:spermidine/putrescine transport system substrate-binding protein
MKQSRFCTAALAAFLFLSLSAPLAAAAPAPETGVTINVYNWGMYISDGTDGYLDVNKAFTEATGIKVNYMTYDSNETLYTKLKTGGVSYDVIIPSDYMIGRLIEEEMLEPLNFDNIPNYRHIDESFRDQAYDPDNAYSVPYTWGTVGLIYNTKFVEEPVNSWDLMWNEKYSGKILMFDNPRDAFAIAQFRLGHDINTEDPAALQAAADDLKTQKPLVQQYVMDQIFDKLQREEAYVGAYYAGDYLMMAEENENLAFCFPEEGFNVFIDGMCIPKGAANKDAAEAYINFLCSPEISGQNLDYLGYSTPISEAKAYMDPEMAESDIAYPDEETLARAQSFSHLAPDTLQTMDNLWLDVKATGGGNTLLMVGIGLVVVLVVVLIGVNQNKKKKMAARRGKKN